MINFLSHFLWFTIKMNKKILDKIINFEHQPFISHEVENQMLIKLLAAALKEEINNENKKEDDLQTRTRST